MKNTTKILSATALAFVSFQGAAQVSSSELIGSADLVRLVINSTGPSDRLQGNATFNFSASCLTTPDGANEWCLSRETSQQLNRLNSASNNGGGFEVVMLPTYGYSAKRVASVLNASGQFGYVEVDPITRTGQGNDGYVSGGVTSTQSVNDPGFAQYQLEYFQSADDSPSGSNILGLWDTVGLDAVKEASEAVDLIVMDSSFVENPETPYTAGGRNFSTTATEQGGEPQQRSDDYRPPAELEGLNCGSHGLEVASIATALIDNNKNIAGITNNAHVHAIRTLTCGTGFLSDSAEALNWLAGKHFENVTPYGGQPGIVNMSFAAQAMGCPEFMQSAINRATEAGFTLVGAAGNDGGDVAEHAPASCDNVITVGSMDREGGKSNFTNSGEQIDIMTQGERIAVTCGDSEYACYGEGTSYAAPVVSGALAITKQVTLADNSLLEFALKNSARKDVLGPDCGDGSCGAGLMDALGVYTIAQSAQNGNLNRIEHALAGKDECEQQWYVDHFGNDGRLCSMYKVTFMGGFHSEGTEYKLLSIPKGGDWETETPVVEGQFTQAVITLESIDADARDYGLQICQEGSCNAIRAMNTELALAEEKPVTCTD